MKTIHKFKLGREPVLMPRGAQLLHVGEQQLYASLFVWALVDTQNEMVKRKLVMVGTGHLADLPNTAVYVGTVQMTAGGYAGLVFHVFDLGEEAP